MKVWKPAKSLVTGKISYIQKDVYTPLIDIFNDWDWWKWFSNNYHDWILKNREILPDEIKSRFQSVGYIAYMNMIVDIMDIRIGYM